MAQDHDQWVDDVLGFSIEEALLDGSTEGTEIDVDTEKAGLDELGLGPADLWDAAVEGFNAAVESVDQQLAALKDALNDTADVALHDIAANGLNAYTVNTRVPLQAAIMDAKNGGSNQLAKNGPNLLKAVAKFRHRLQTPPFAACDNNPFDVTVDIAGTYGGALDKLVYAVKMAA